MSGILLEVIAVDLDDATRAADGGADRLEVCAGMDRDGTTPALSTVEAICSARLPLDVMAMVRPRGGDFVYAPAELRAMADRIREFKAAGVDGVVLGVLTAAASVDEPALARLVRAADGLSVTFHRAFDCVDDRSAALRELESGGADRVLTLGYPVGAPRQPTDVERVSVAAGDAGGRLAVMTGGLLEDYAPTRLRAAGIREFHLGRAVREGESYERPIDPERVRAWRARLEGR